MERPDRFDSSTGSLGLFLLTQAHGRAVDAVRSLTARHRRELQAQRTAASSYDLEHQVWDLASRTGSPRPSMSCRRGAPGY